MGTISSLNSLLGSGTTNSSSGVDLSSLLAAVAGVSTPGINVSAAVDAAVYAAQAPERQWQQQQSAIQNQLSALSSIQAAATSLNSDLSILRDSSGTLAARTVSSSMPSAVTATASSGSAAGTHSIQVSHMATVASWYSAEVSSSSSSLGGSTLVISTGDGTQHTFDLSHNSNSSLTSLTQSINAAGLGMSARIVQDTAGARLALVSTQTGSAADFQVSSSADQESKFVSADLQGASTGLAAQTFQIGDGTNTQSVNVAEGTSLSALVDQINGLGLQLSASVVSDDGGAHLQVDGTAGNAVGMSSDPTLNFVQASQGQDASLKVDGIPFKSSSNTVTGALDGTTLTLTGTTPVDGDAALTVAPDSSAIQGAVAKFVGDYNALAALVNDQFTFNAATGSQGVLGNNADIRSFQAALQSSLGYSSSAGNQGISTLHDLGISVQDDGTMKLDSTVLAHALTQAPDAIQNFFAGSTDTGFAGKMQSQLSFYSDPGAGVLALSSSGLRQRYSSLQEQISSYESGYIASQRSELTSMYSKAEIALQSLPSTLKQIQAEMNGNSGS